MKRKVFKFSTNSYIHWNNTFAINQKCLIFNISSLEKSEKSQKLSSFYIYVLMYLISSVGNSCQILFIFSYIAAHSQIRNMKVCRKLLVRVDRLPVHLSQSLIFCTFHAKVFWNKFPIRWSLDKHLYTHVQYKYRALEWGYMWSSQDPKETFLYNFIWEN